MSKTPNISVRISLLVGSVVLTLTTSCITETTNGGVGHERATQGHLTDGAPTESTTGNAAEQRIEKPTTVRRLLLNIKVALEQGLLLPREFYSDDNLTRVFGASRVQWLINTDLEIYVRLFGLDYLPIRDDTFSNAGVTRHLINAQNRLSADGKVYVGIGIECFCRLRIEDIEAVFGTVGSSVVDEREREAHSRSELPGLPRATDPMGNKRVTYEVLTSPAYRSEFSVLFDPNGNVKAFEGMQTEE